MKTKICTLCKKEKTLSEYHDNNRGSFGKHSMCKICRNRRESNRKMKRYRNDSEYRAKVNECNRKQSRERTLKNPDYQIDLHMKSRYDISLKEYNELFESQKGVCAICQKPETQKHNDKIKRLHIDHDHVTGKIRALLCSECNTGIGKFKDNIEILHKAISYLEKHSNMNRLLKQFKE